MIETQIQALLTPVAKTYRDQMPDDDGLTPISRAPFIVYSDVSYRGLFSLKGATGYGNSSFQVDCYGASRGDASRLRDAVYQAFMAPPAGIKLIGITGLGSDYETDTKLFKQMMEYHLEYMR